MFNETYIKLMNDCFEIKKGIKEFQYINISTITIIGKLNNEHIDIKKLSESFESPQYPSCVVKKTKKHGEYEESSRGKKKKSFYNQITIQYKDYSKVSNKKLFITKSIKIFSNGMLQMTGVTSLIEAETIGTMICKILTDHFPLDKEFTVKSLEIGMINSNFSFGYDLNILKYKNIYQSEKCNVEYVPDVYPGLKIKYGSNEQNKGTSIFVFATGNVLITGSKSLEEIREAFLYIVESTLNNWQHTSAKQKPDKSLNYKTTYNNGYEIAQFQCASQPNFNLY